MGRTLAFLAVLLSLSAGLQARTALKHTKGSPLRSLHALEKDLDYVDLSAFPHVRIKLKYATTDNFMGLNMYGPFRKAFLHKDAAAMFRRAVNLLQKERPGYSFVVFDALRPHSVQWIMWDRVKDTPERKYVANAEIGSPHNFGMAIDLSVLDEKGRELDMGTPFDSFSEVSEPKLEQRFLEEGKLTKGQMENRLILRRAMTGAGFLQLSHEWWHYNGLPEPEIRKKYKIVE
ncbi:MAG TPA: M15 family metallopeptidase [bacterium]|nr:M15 family metallopeptidase [bacterium]